VSLTITSPEVGRPATVTSIARSTSNSLTWLGVIGMMQCTVTTDSDDALSFAAFAGIVAKPVSPMANSAIRHVMDGTVRRVSTVGNRSGREEAPALLAAGASSRGERREDVRTQ
jgi:hypothetical protein